MGGFATVAVCTAVGYSSSYHIYDTFISPTAYFSYTGLVQGGNCSFKISGDTGGNNTLVEVFNITNPGQFNLEPFNCNLTTLTSCQTGYFLVTDQAYQQITEEFENFLPGISSGLQGLVSESNFTYFVLPPVPSQPASMVLDPTNTSVLATASQYSVEYGAPLIGCVLSAQTGFSNYEGQDLPAFLNADGSSVLPYTSFAVYGVPQSQSLTFNLTALHLRPNTAYDYAFVCYNANGRSPQGSLFQAVTSPLLPQPAVTTASLCFIFYGLPGNVDYPWSVAISMTVQYYGMSVFTSAGTAVTVINGTGTRTFTNRFATVTVNTFTVASAGQDFANNLLYLNSAFPVDGSGLTLNFSSPIQLPGKGPSALYTQVNIYNQSGVVLEGGASRVDPLGSAFLSNLPRFTNVTIGASNLNALAPSYATCTATITFTNGLRPPTQPTVSNGGVHVYYSYFISDGVTYSVQANLTFTTASAFGNNHDSLGNPYQNVIGVTGTRAYKYFPTNSTLISTINGLSTIAYNNADQRFYPYALLGASPGVYSINTAPFFDYDGVEFNLSPSVPKLGLPVGQGTQYNATSLYFTTSETTAVLTEVLHTQHPPHQHSPMLLRLILFHSLAPSSPSPVFLFNRAIMRPSLQSPFSSRHTRSHPNESSSRGHNRETQRESPSQGERWRTDSEGSEAREEVRYKL